MQTQTSSAWVVGSDLDLPLVRSLEEGDHVLLEANGRHAFSALPAPVSDQTWEVVSNGESELVLRNPLLTRDVTISYDNLYKLPGDSPAVFKMEEPLLTDGVVYCILQFASHRVPAEDVDRLYPIRFNAQEMVSKYRDVVVEKLAESISKFSYPGWVHNGVCRFALRSGVRLAIINAFRERNQAEMSKVTDAKLVSMVEAVNWLPHLLSQSRPYDARAEYMRPARKP